MLLNIYLFHSYSRRDYGEPHCIPNTGAIAIGPNLIRNQDRRSLKFVADGVEAGHLSVSCDITNIVIKRMMKRAEL